MCDVVVYSRAWLYNFLVFRAGGKAQQQQLHMRWRCFFFRVCCCYGVAQVVLIANLTRDRLMCAGVFGFGVPQNICVHRDRREMKDVKKNKTYTTVDTQQA